MGYFKDIFGENVSPSSNPRLLNDLLTSYFLINLDLFLSQTACVDEHINLPLYVFVTMGVLLYVFYLLLKQYNDIVLNAV